MKDGGRGRLDRIEAQHVLALHDLDPGYRIERALGVEKGGAGEIVARLFGGVDRRGATFQQIERRGRDQVRGDQRA